MTEEKRRSTDTENKYLSWKWLAGILLTTTMLLTGVFVGGGLSDSKADSKMLSEKIAVHSDRLAIVETNLVHITQSLGRIEKKLDENNGKKR
jgi:hypothetical protein